MRNTTFSIDYNAAALIVSHDLLSRFSTIVACDGRIDRRTYKTAISIALCIWHNAIKTKVNTNTNTKPVYNAPISTSGITGIWERKKVRVKEFAFKVTFKTRLFTQVAARQLKEGHSSSLDY